MKITTEVNKELKELWEMRDNAKSEASREKAQMTIDEYFLGSPKQEKKKRKKKRKQNIIEDDCDWEDYYDDL